MAKFVVTGNLTREGLSAYLRLEGGQRGWTPDLAQAAVVDGEDAAEALVKSAQPDIDATLVVGVYHFEVEMKDGRPEPKTARERIRASHRPTVPFGGG
jgi:sulfite reductase (NADPH) hemoprotein beta-component